MSMLESHREAAIDYRFPRQTLISILVFCVAWEVLSQLSPYLGIPPFAVPSFVRIGQSLMKITAIDVIVTLARVLEPNSLKWNEQLSDIAVEKRASALPHSRG